MFRGLAHLSLVADDIAAATAWYTVVIGHEPYFVMPEDGPSQYVEWRFGDDQDELALVSSAYRPLAVRPGGAVASLHVDDIYDAFESIVEHGAEPFEPITPRGEGWWSAIVADPFGNLVGLIQSPRWADRHAARV